MRRARRELGAPDDALGARHCDRAGLVHLHASLLRWLERCSSLRLRSGGGVEDALQQSWLELLRRTAERTALFEGAEGRERLRWLISTARWNLLRVHSVRPEFQTAGREASDEPAHARCEPDPVESSSQLLQSARRSERLALLLRAWFDAPFETVSLALDSSSTHAARCTLSRATARARGRRSSRR